MDLAQEQMFDAYLTKHAPSETYKRQMLAILNLCRKTVFLHNAQINWQANIWYLDGLRIAEHRLNRSSSVTSVSFTKISHKENRRYAKEYMKYQIGVTGQAIGTIATRYCLLERFWYAYRNKVRMPQAVRQNRLKITSLSYRKVGFPQNPLMRIYPG